jgi:hypothetical protein
VKSDVSMVASSIESGTKAAVKSITLITVKGGSSSTLTESNTALGQISYLKITNSGPQPV